MRKTILHSYNDYELKELVRKSTSYKDLARNMGYTHGASGDTVKNLKKLVEKFDTSHFQTTNPSGINPKLDDSDIFKKDSGASQSAVRKHYRAGNYSEYKCSICGQLPMWNGQELTLILDHRNGVASDHRLENLRWVCPNCNQQLPTTGSRNPNRTTHKKIWYCQDCGVEVFKGSKRCNRCEAKSRVMPEKTMPISRKDLKQLIYIKPFVQIGKQFGVNDNTIRKWCDKYGLPRKTSEIKKYSPEEWELI